MAAGWLRLVWFVLVGWWLAIFWFAISLILMISIIGFPIGAYMATKTWHIMTLKSSPQKVVVEVQSNQ